MTTDSHDQAPELDHWLTNTLAIADRSNLKWTERFMFVVMCFEAATHSRPVGLPESEWAAQVGMTRHQARQAIAGLRRANLATRVWSTPEDGSRPIPSYRPIVGWLGETDETRPA